MALFYSSGTANYVGVSDIAAANAWYIEKFGLRKVKIELDNGEDCMALGFDKDDCAICLGPRSGSAEELSPRRYCSSAKKAREFLASRVVAVGEIRKDSQGTNYFEMRDMEGNLIEICEEP
jgi:catechol 2,3-dioxygenase-like lactoylglutathione lyase family enzyme